MTMTNEELIQFIQTLTASQSMLLAAVLRPFVNKGLISHSDLAQSLDATERAALERRTSETPALTGLIDLLRRDLGFDKATDRDDA